MIERWNGGVRLVQARLQGIDAALTTSCASPAPPDRSIKPGHQGVRYGVNALWVALEPLKTRLLTLL